MSDNKLPYVRWFPSDYLAAIRGMRANEVGIYTILLNEMYERCEPLPNNADMLSRRCGTSKTTFKSVLKMLIAERKIIVIDEKLWNKRVEKEFEFRRTRSQSSKRAAEIRWEKHNEINEDGMQPQCERNASGMREVCVEDAKPEARSQKPETIKNKNPDGPIKYKYKGFVVKLTFEDYNRWESTYSHIPDFKAKLTQIDDWIAEQPEKDQKRWFVIASSMLNKENQKLAAQKPKPNGKANDEIWMHRMNGYVKDKSWDTEHWGFPPDHKATEVPARILKQFKIGE